MKASTSRYKVSSITGDFIFDHGDRESYIYVIVAMDHKTHIFSVEMFTPRLIVQ